jgi:hypothetical protein
MKAEREVPHIARPIDVHGYRIRAVHHFGPIRGMTDHQGAGGFLVWTQKIYDVVFDPHLERDVQEIYINSMHYEEKFDRIELTDERNRTYRVHWKDGRLLP